MHTPGTEPAAQAYNDRVVPIRRSINRAFHGTLTSVRRELLADPDLFYELAQFHTHLMAADAALQRYVGDPAEVSLRAYEFAAREFDDISRAIGYRIDEAPKAGSQVMLGLARFVTQEAGAYQLRAIDLTWSRRQREGTVAESLFHYRALPLAQIVSQQMRYISTVQAAAVADAARLFAVLSIAIIAGALLIGITSASTLYVSFRIRSRVHRALDRARKLGQYTVERKIGAGAIGEVYLASHAMLRRPAAIKLLRSEGQASEQAKKRFRREVQLTSRLSHPNTVSVFDYGVTPDGTFYYAMEYLEGATLQQIVDATGPMSQARVIHVLRQVAGSLEEAHNGGLLHRDIKPTNIMLCELGGLADTVKVLDFGLVREVSDSAGPATDEGWLEGTPLYIAPETVLDPTAVEARSDLFAVGAVGYFLLCGAPPFDGEDVIDLLCKHVDQVPVPPSQRSDRPVDPELERLVLDCLEKDVNRRPANALELRQRINALQCPDRWSESDGSSWWSEFGEVVENHGLRSDGPNATASTGVAVRLSNRTRA